MLVSRKPCVCESPPSTSRAITGIIALYDIANVSGPSASRSWVRVLGCVETYFRPSVMLLKNGSRTRPLAPPVCTSGTTIWIVQIVAKAYIAAWR